MTEREIPGVRVLCGISSGKARSPHGVTLAVIGVDRRKLVDLWGVRPGALIHSNGTRWKMVLCPRHGVLAVTEGQVLTAYERWATNPKRGVARLAAKQRVSAARVARARP